MTNDPQTTDPVLALVRAARPDTAPAVSTLLAERGPDVLAGVLAGPGPGTVATVPVLHRRRRVLGLAAAATVVATGLVVGLPAEQGTAFAAWTPAPHRLTPAQEQARAQACVTGFGDPGTDPATARVLLAEARGPYALAVVRSATTTVFCQFLDPARTQPVAADLLPTGAPVTGDRVTVEEMSGGGQGDGAYSAATGRTGPDVTGVDLLTAQGTVRASTADGRWAAWWPGADGGQAGAVRVTVHTATGERSTTVDQLRQDTGG